MTSNSTTEIVDLRATYEALLLSLRHPFALGLGVKEIFKRDKDGEKYNDYIVQLSWELFKALAENSGPSSPTALCANNPEGCLSKRPGERCPWCRPVLSEEEAVEVMAQALADSMEGTGSDSAIYKTFSRAAYHALLAAQEAKEAVWQDNSYLYGYQDASAEKDERIKKLEEALRALRTAVVYTGVENLPNNAGKGYIARVPERFILDADDALQDLKGPNNDK